MPARRRVQRHPRRETLTRHLASLPYRHAEATDRNDKQPQLGRRIGIRVE
jgi:hypothetical protein